METDHDHRWDVSPSQAIAIQERLREEVERQDRLGDVRRVAGVDVGYDRSLGEAHAAVAVLDFPGLSLAEQASSRRPVSFPYIPGLLSFREAPAALEAFAKLSTPPDMLLCDGHGLAHPRRFGLACHLGVLTGLPTIGVAKKRLVGEHAPVPDARGAWEPLVDGDEVIGAALRTREGVKPIYVSIGHRIRLETAVAYVLRCTPRYRLPETTRQAHRMASGAVST